ncbi:sigma-54 dependent transcriptional regulator [bacterium]|nr:sigma-54 dependent transcriptional regulator [bacterium]MBU1633103.1 sigma-54 dependent transcriptional regulator [bacterium]MBU1874277.1 sigma-54 dependent transcriptional regulator [bacterium]
MHILIIDDEKNIRQALSGILTDEGHTVSLAETGEEGLLRLGESLVDLVFLDVKLPKMSGIDVLKQTRNDWPSVDVLMISGDSDINTAVNAVKMGAHDFMEKPLSLPKILIAVQNISEKRKLVQKCIIGDENIDFRYRIIGHSSQINTIREMIRRVAKTDAKVLITGESGTGKELVAYAIHKMSLRSDNPFITFNSAAIPNELVESELFGHEKGAFTGADRQKPGKLEGANHGTIFLDEIGDMNINAQSKILRVLEEGKFERVGGNRTIDIDVRVLAATNRNIEEMIKTGSFREDLYYRLNVVPFFLPPLRERPGDIPVLLDHYLQAFSNELTTAKKHFSGAAQDILKNYHFPGNIRELKNLVERLYILSDKDEIDENDIRQNLAFQKSTGQNILKNILHEDSYSDAKRSFETYYFTEKLKLTGWNISRLANEIGVLQPNLSRKLKILGIRTPGDN